MKETRPVRAVPTIRTWIIAVAMAAVLLAACGGGDQDSTDTSAVGSDQQSGSSSTTSSSTDSQPPVDESTDTTEPGQSDDEPQTTTTEAPAPEATDYPTWDGPVAELMPGEAEFFARAALYMPEDVRSAMGASMGVPCSGTHAVVESELRFSAREPAVLLGRFASEEASEAFSEDFASVASGCAYQAQAGAADSIVRSNEVVDLAGLQGRRMTVEGATGAISEFTAVPMGNIQVLVVVLRENAEYEWSDADLGSIISLIEAKLLGEADQPTAELVSLLPTPPGGTGWTAEPYVISISQAPRVLVNRSEAPETLVAAEYAVIGDAGERPLWVQSFTFADKSAAETALANHTSFLQGGGIAGEVSVDESTGVVTLTSSEFDLDSGEFNGTVAHYFTDGDGTLYWLRATGDSSTELLGPDPLGFIATVVDALSGG